MELFNGMFFHCVTFSENEEINDVIQQGLSRGNESQHCCCFDVI